MNAENDVVNTQRLMNQIKKGILNGTQSFSSMDDSALAQACILQSVRSFLTGLAQSRSITEYQIDGCRVVTHTWKTLYPKLGSRLLARIGNTFVNNEACSPRWFHKILPFVVSHTVLDDDGYEVDQYRAVMAKPYRCVVVEYGIKPVLPISEISLNLVITREGTNFDKGVK